MQIIYEKIDNIKPYNNNARINTNSVKLVAESIKKFGFKVPILVDENYNIVAGHTRLEASKLLNIKEVPIIMIEDLTEEQINAFRLIDNKTNEFSQWDDIKLEEELNKIKNVDMESLGFIKEKNDIDWDVVEDLTDDLYEEPELDMMECPYCHHIDRNIHFKKIKE